MTNRNVRGCESKMTKSDYTDIKMAANSSEVWILWVGISSTGLILEIVTGLEYFELILLWLLISVSPMQIYRLHRANP